MAPESLAMPADIWVLHMNIVKKMKISKSFETLFSDLKTCLVVSMTYLHSDKTIFWENISRVASLNPRKTFEKYDIFDLNEDWFFYWAPRLKTHDNRGIRGIDFNPKYRSLLNRKQIRDQIWILSFFRQVSRFPYKFKNSVKFLKFRKIIQFRTNR